jgi:hypothetical protein
MVNAPDTCAAIRPLPLAASCSVGGQLPFGSPLPVQPVPRATRQRKTPDAGITLSAINKADRVEKVPAHKLFFMTVAGRAQWSERGGGLASDAAGPADCNP